MHSQMLTSRLGAELISYKLDGIEKIHQGQDCIDENLESLLETSFSSTISNCGKVKTKQDNYKWQDI